MATSYSDEARVVLILSHFSVALDGVAFAAFKRLVYDLVIVSDVIFIHVGLRADLLGDGFLP